MKFYFQNDEMFGGIYILSENEIAKMYDRCGWREGFRENANGDRFPYTRTDDECRADFTSSDEVHEVSHLRDLRAVIREHFPACSEYTDIQCDEWVSTLPGFRELEDASNKTYVCRDSGNELEILAESPRAAAEDYVEGGVYRDDDEGTVWVDVWVREQEAEGEDENDEQQITITIHPPEPDCDSDEGEHDWLSPEWLGGCTQNPGVWGHGGGSKGTYVCSRCGVYQHWDNWAQRPDTGEQGLDSVKYEAADDQSREWVDEKGRVTNEPETANTGRCVDCKSYESFNNCEAKHRDTNGVDCACYRKAQISRAEKALRDLRRGVNLIWMSRFDR